MNNTSLNLPVAELNVHRVLSTKNQSESHVLTAEPHVLPAEPHVLSNVTKAHALIRNGIHGFFLLLIFRNHAFHFLINLYFYINVIRKILYSCVT